MRKVLFVILLVTIMIGSAACGSKKQVNIEETLYTDSKEIEQSNTETTEKDIASSVIAEQSFEVELNGWGKVMFVSMTPENNKCGPSFTLQKDGKVIYTFPKKKEENEAVFSKIEAVSFKDYNWDNKTDIIVLIQYTDGSKSWNDPQIFLQENSDNMFYLDYPSLETFKLEAKAEGGPSFYRDTYLEKYLSEHNLTDKVSDIAGSFAEYMEFLDETFYAFFTVERQIELFAQQRDVWINDLEYANERYCYTLARLNDNGKVILIVSNYGGTGHYTVSHFYQIDKTGNVKELESSFTEYQSQPDLMDEGEMTLFSSDITGKVVHYYIVHDEIKVSPNNYVYETGAISIVDDKVIYSPLAVQNVVYEGEGLPPTASFQDDQGNPLSEEEYNSFAENYYSNKGYKKNTASMEWKEIINIAEAEEDEAKDMLMQVYEGFKR